MPKICYQKKAFRDSSKSIITKANEIIAEYLEDDLTLTLRQLYYQFVSRDLIQNSQREYKRLGSIINDARLAGLIDWNTIEDRTRFVRHNSHFNDPGDVLLSAFHQFQVDHWQGQPIRVEVWIEKEALIGVIARICRTLDVPYFACKGFVSASEMHSAAKRFEGYVYQGISPVIIHLGDHDPSGIDMTRDIIDRMDIFEAGVGVERIALNMDQIELYNPPKNPAKLSDTRAKGYIEKFGSSSYELDALEPRVIRDLIKEYVESYRVESIYNKVLEQEAEYKAILKRVADNWQEL